MKHTKQFVLTISMEEIVEEKIQCNKTDTNYTAHQNFSAEQKEKIIEQLAYVMSKIAGK